MSDTNQAPTTEPKNWSLLARDAFGSEFHGEVTEPVEEPGKVLEAQEPEPEEVKAEPEQVEVEEEPISSIEQLIEVGEYDPEWFNNLDIGVKVNGETSKAKLTDLVKSYQIQQAAEQRLTDAKEKSKAETSALAQRREALNGEFNALATLIQEAEGVLGEQFSKVDWAKLRTEDPAEFSARHLEFSQKQARIESLKGKAREQYQNHAKSVSGESETEKAARLAQEGEKLVSQIPEWKDAEKAKAEQKAIGEFLLGNGFSQDEVSQVYDHRMVVLARKAMLFDKGQNKAEVAKKKVLTVPKVLKPGAPQTQEQGKQAKIAEAEKRLRKSGSMDDAVALRRLQRSL